MILQALCRCYDVMAADDNFNIVPMGYSKVGCSWAIKLRADGTAAASGPIPLSDEKSGQMLTVPLQPGRSGKNPAPYILCDKSKYFLGAEIPTGGKELVATPASLENSLKRHQEVFSDVEDDGAKAVLRFLERMRNGEQLDIAPDHSIYKSGNIVFRLSGERGYIHERPAVKQAWERYLDKQSSEDPDSLYGECLITGEKDVKIARTHTMFKKILGSNTTGANIVSFNFRSAESYGKSQSYNAPVSEEAMFKYSTALQTLLDSRQTRLYVGDMTVVFWAESNLNLYAPKMQEAFSGETEQEEKFEDGGRERVINSEDTRTTGSVVWRAGTGQENRDVDCELDPNTNIYILGLSPNVSRISVRFWYQDTFGHFKKMVDQHYADMNIVRSPQAKPKNSVRDLLASIAVQGKTENLPKTLEGSLIQAILSGNCYPKGVYQNVLMRIRAEAGDNFAVNFTRASFIKAYLTRLWRKEEQQKEEITVALNENQSSVGYQLGRLFAVLERIQEDAGNTGLRERYFQGASTTPANVFPNVMQLAQHHIEKVKKDPVKSGSAVYFDRIVSEIINRIDRFPTTLTMEEQGMFIIGYYHQRQAIYTKREPSAQV